MQNYTVKQGDTLNSIAKSFGYDNYKSAGLTAKSGNPDLIRPGEVYSVNPSATSPAKNAYVATVAGTGSAGAPQTNTSTPAATPTASPFSAYSNYLKQYSSSLAENPDVTNATNDLNNIRTSQDRQTLDARKAYEDLIHEAGGTRGGALESGSVSNRNNSYIQANLGVAESGAARKLDALTGQQTAKQNYLKTQAELSAPMKVGDKYFDPQTGKEITGVTDPKEKTGIVGEYEYAKSQGYTGSFSQYQNEDANRKAVRIAPSYSETKDVNLKNDQKKIASELNSVVGQDGFVSPTDYKTLKRAWVADGYASDDFDSIFSGYVNPKYAKDYGTGFQTKVSSNDSGIVNPFE